MQPQGMSASDRNAVARAGRAEPLTQFATRFSAVPVEARKGPPMQKQIIAAVVLAALASLSSAEATTKGLNQIVTPDIQPAGVLSISLQAEDPAIGNSKQLQFELGLSKNFEVALLRGLSPGQFAGGMEYGLVQKPSFLLSAGFLAPGPGQGVQPFLEAGFLHQDESFTIGALRQGGHAAALLGWDHRVNSRLHALADYESGADNFATVGFTLGLSPALTFNPALYIANSSPHTSYGYAVLTWNLPI
jgi:hypothetical protein